MARSKQREAPQESPFNFSPGAPGAVSAPGAGEGASAVPGQGAAGAGRVPYRQGDITDSDAFGFRQARKQADLNAQGVPSVFGSAEPDDVGPQYGYSKRRLRRRDEVSVYTAQMDARYAMDVRKRRLIILCVSLVVAIPTMLILPVMWMNPNSVGSATVGEEVFARVSTLIRVFQGDPQAMSFLVLMTQEIAVVMVGAALALNGAVYQGVLKNAMAAPATLGIVAGGTLGTLVYTLLYCIPDTYEMFTFVKASELSAYFDSLSPWEYFITVYGRALWSVGGCMLAAAFVLGVSYVAGRGRMSKVVLIITGQVFSAVAAGITTCIRLYLTMYGTLQEQSAMMTIMTGSLDYIMFPVDLLFLGIPLFFGIGYILLMRNKLNLLAFDDDEARAAGLNPTRTRNAVVIVCTVLTAVCVSYVGSVGFVGFVVPHIVRKIVGPEFRYFLPASLAAGSLYLLIAWYLVHLNPAIGGLGAFTTIIGAAFFVGSVIWQRARGNADWI